MKRFIFLASMVFWLIACSTTKNSITTQQSIKASIDLVNVIDDKVMVTIQPPVFNELSTTYFFPKIIPGTYSEDNYGKYIDDFKVFDAKGKPIEVVKLDENSYQIKEAKNISKITYWVNDTYDTEKGGGFGESGDIFSPAGTNIEAGKNFMLNLHGFIGYFENKKDYKFTLNIKHPNLYGSTAAIDLDNNDNADLFEFARYADLTDTPIMYAKPDFTRFEVEGMEILIGVYSPNGKHKAADITPETENFMRAQKRFLGNVNDNQKYAVILYLSDLSRPDAKGFGALEHMNSTVVVFPEMMPLEALQEQLKDVVSHEFFHILTPLSVHSKEIHYFDYNQPNMSQHLWMYEGITEYFANLFQVNQGLITEEAFYNRMNDKIAQSLQMNDKMSFTKMSKNVLQSPYKEEYLNVYNKGALIAMCLDIQIRELSNGDKGILWLMKELSKQYGKNKPFDDNELFSIITKLTYPEIGKFFDTHVIGETPIPYALYFSKMGVSEADDIKTGNPFLKDGQFPLIKIDGVTKQILADKVDSNPFFKTLQIKDNDVLMAFDEVDYNLDNIYDLLMASEGWQEGNPIKVKVNRDGKQLILEGKIALPKEEVKTYKFKDSGKDSLKNAWLKG